MAVTATIQHRRTNRENHPEIHDRTTALDHATRVIYRVCCLAGSANLIDKIRVDLEAEGVRAAIRKRDSAAVFDWLANRAGLDETEMLRTFNCGLGLIAVVAKSKAGTVMAAFNKHGERADVVGTLVRGRGKEAVVRYRGRLN